MEKVIEKAKHFLDKTLGIKANGGDIRIIGIDQRDDYWLTDAEVTERNLSLPGYRVFEKKYYTLKLNKNLEILSFKQVSGPEHPEREEEEAM